MATEQRVGFAAREAHTQRPAPRIRGSQAIPGALVLLVTAAALVVVGLKGHDTAPIARVGIVLAVVALVVVQGFVVVQPNEARVVVLFGRYVGTLLDPGLWWVNPLTARSRTKISLRVRNFQGQRIKVNDSSGNPIELAAVVVWRVVDTAKAVFDVEDLEQFVVVQSETAVRFLAARYPYDDYVEGSVSLRRTTGDILQALHAELQARLETAGIEVLETRLTHLAYAPEIAEVMLRRQQAEAVLAARKTMVQGAVGLVEMALQQLEETELIELDPERKAAMVSNLMVVLSGDHAPTPVLNTGTLYT
jgi:regulator of protease activity HflC (stomatin/prohibitin superfamily)